MLGSSCDKGLSGSFVLCFKAILDYRAPLREENGPEQATGKDLNVQLSRYWYWYQSPGDSPWVCGGTVCSCRPGLWVR